MTEFYPDDTGRKDSMRATGTVTYGDRIVERNCVDVSKRIAYHKRFSRATKVNELKPFLPNHDFQRDDKYLELSRRLSYVDIEFAKYTATGDNVTWAARQMFSNTKTGDKVYHAKRKFLTSRLPMTTPLIEYFRMLLGIMADPGTYTIDEAFKSLVADVRQAKPGKERFDLTMKLLDTFGLEKQLKEVGAKFFVNIEGINSGPTGVPNLEKARALASTKVERESNGVPA